MKILVTDGNSRAALAITRALGKEGYEVVVCAEKQPCLASVSRFCMKGLSYPSPEDSPSEFILRILEITQNEQPDVLLPVSEITTLLVMAEKDNLEKYSAIPFSNLNSVDRAANKYEVIALAKKLNIPVPETIILEKPEEFSAALNFFKERNFPVVIKPSRSRISTQDGWQETVVKYANNTNELQGIVDDTPVGSYPLLFQERIIGSGVGVFVCFNHGEMLTAFSHRRIREKPPSGGVSVLRTSIPVDEKLKRQSNKLLQELEWHGVAMVEFKQDNRDGEFKLMEINGRFWGSLQLAIDAGVNFPLLSAKIAMGDNVKPVTYYKNSVKTRWFWGDMDALLSRLFKRNSTLNLPPGYPGRMKCVLDFLKFWGKDLHYEVLNWDDIKPWLFETRRWFFQR